MADGKVTIDTSLDTKGFSKGITSMEKGLGGLKSTLLEIGKTLAAVFAVGQIINFGKECIELGSNVAEVQNVVDVAFGDMAGQVEEFAQSAITNFGMSSLAAKKTSSTYMSMARGMGVAMDSAAEMSLALTGLSGDVASFYNITQEEAAYKLQSVFTGETESLKELGVVMTQTNLQQYAMQHGMNSNIQSMTQAEQVALRYAYVTDQLALASGDFARTQDSWANQTRILSMQWQEFMSIIGQALTQILLPAVKVLNQIVSALINAANALSSALTSIFGGTKTEIQQTAADVGGVSTSISDAVENQEALADATKETNKAQEKSLASFDEINKLSAPAASSSGGATGGTAGAGDIGGTAAGLQTVETKVTDAGEQLLNVLDRVREALEPFRASFETAFSSIKSGAMSLFEVFSQAWNDIKTLGSPLYDWFSGPITKLINQFITTFGNTLGGLLDSVAMIFSDVWSIAIFPAIQKWITDIGPALTDFFTAALSTFDVLFNSVKKLFDTIWQDAIAPSLQVIYDIWSDTWDSILAAWEEHGQTIFDKIKEAISGLADTLMNVWKTIFKPTWDKIMDVVSELWDDHVKPLWDNLLDFVGSLSELALNVYNNFILPIANWFIDLFGPSISKAVGGAIEIFGELVGGIIDGASWIIENLTKIVDFLSGVFTTDLEKVFDNIARKVKDTVNTMTGFVESFVNFFIRGINRVIEALNSLSVDVPDWVPGIGGNSFGINIPTIPELKLPRLAQGAVIPPNREFLAVLGDQNTGTNIEAPLATIEKAVENVIARRGFTDREITLRLVSDRGFVRSLKVELDKESQRRGVKLVRGGVNR